jgi:hypothetical protein
MDASKGRGAAWGQNAKRLETHPKRGWKSAEDGPHPASNLANRVEIGIITWWANLYPEHTNSKASKLWKKRP